MKLLLDTHIWIWSHREPERLGRRVRRALEDSANELWLSPVSVWELGLLADAGRVKVVGHSVSEWVARALGEMPLRDAAMNREVALETRAVRLQHHDPADRLLAATARVFDLALVTADERMLRGSGFRTMKNT
jgi:PIN domain nuclease of toxin-antitoxin system